MTTPQILSFATLAGMMGLFIWGRLRYDLVAIVALLVAVALGIVPPDKAFTGFSDDIVIIVASALVVSAAVSRSGLIEAGLALVAKHTRQVRSQLLLLVGSVTFLSAGVKNIGALAMLMPAAFNLAKKSETSPSVFLMPMSFGSLLGGLMTLIGTSPNIIVSRVREQLTGHPFRMFDYLPVGFCLAVAGIVFLRFGYRLLPRDRRGAPELSEAVDIEEYVTEATVPEKAAAIGWDREALTRKLGEDVELVAITRGEAEEPIALDGTTIAEGDTLRLRGEPDALERAIASAGLRMKGEERIREAKEANEEVGVLEAVITDDSLLVGRTARGVWLHRRFGVNLLAISRAGQRITEALRDTPLRAGDVIVLQGAREVLPAQLAALGCLPLAEREIRLGGVRKRLLPIAILAAAMASTAAGFVPVAVAFFAAAGLIVLSGALPIREAYDRIEWPILIMLGALIPVAQTLETTGGSALIADWLSQAAASLPPWGAVMLTLVAAMAVTPFLNNAATVLVVAPIAARFATDLHMRPDAFLMATAIGAGCDFLTPIGHQCNTLVMGPGGYRFSDYARLGAPLSLIVILLGTPLIMLFWPVG
ncbi:MAG TPA: SLC13 family permease [Sphingomonas sp.]|nr:SLC13 family permease [Sphingomonas sp.]